MKASEIMTEYPHIVTPDDPVSHAAALMRDSDVGFIPVVADRDSQRLVGVITDRDLAVRHVANAHEEDCRVGQHMTSENLASVTPDTPMPEVHELMKDRQVRRIPVLSGEGRIVGVIAQADVAVKEQRPDAAGQTVAEISEPAKPHR